MADLPEYDETVECTNPLCVHAEKNKPITGLHGLAGGGGIGPYTVCEFCGTILTKTYDSEILCESHDEDRKPVEIKDATEDSADNQEH
jgi:hypothetical protein